MSSIVSFSKALADPTRWRIIRLVMDNAFCVCELADILEMPHSSVSSHVQIIRKAGMLESEKREKWTYFQTTPRFSKLLRSMDSFFSAEEDPVAKADIARAIERLEKRAGSCCPGPVKLRSRRPLAQTIPL